MIRGRYVAKLLSLFLNIVAMMLAACSESRSEQSKLSGDSNSSILSDVFAEVLSVQPNVPGAGLTGDFDGDGAADTLWMVTQSKSVLPAGVTLMEPWPHYEDTPPSKDLTKGSKVRLAIIHGRNNRAFLIRDTNSISPLDTPAAQEINILAKNSIADLEESELTKVAKGDIIVVPTEAGIDNYLYWDGSQYLLYEVFDLP